MSTEPLPQSVGTDRTAPDSNASHTNHVPRGYHADHQAPSAFVLRCSECGRLRVQNNRGNAIRSQANHALDCEGAVGLTPISPRDQPDDSDALAVQPGDLDPRITDLTGSDVQVTYRSAQGRENIQRRRVSVDRMLSAHLDAATHWRGFEATAENGVTLRVTADGDAPGVYVDADNGRRRIGRLDAVQPITQPSDGRQPVATDGGER